MGESDGGALLKRRRVTRACDRCHRGGIKCSPSRDPSICDPCAAFGSVCTYDRPMKRRGPPPTRLRDINLKTKPDRDKTGVGPVTIPRIKDESNTSPSASPYDTSDDEWTYPNIVSHEQISSLIDAYYCIAYPIYPIFHWPTLIKDIRRHLYMRSRPFCAAVMGMCALASARLEDGVNASLIRTKFPPPSIHGPHQKSKALCHACETLIPADLSLATHVDYKRAKIILTCLGMQFGQPQRMHKHLGDYLTMCAVDGFHNEARWPSGLKEYEIQERRRLFWVGYQTDVYAAVTWGGMLHHRESQCTVLYPAEVFSDDDITDEGFIKPPSTRGSPGGPVSFLRGWNFVTDLYRLLEHTLSQLRTRRQIHDVGNPIDTLFLNKGKAKETVGFEVDELLALVQRLHDDLPKEFKSVDHEMTGEENKDRYGFQATNMLVTFQTLKMVMAGMADWSVEQRCAIAGELVDAFATLPVTYVQALSSPLLLHLAGVGHLLASILSSPLSPANYLHLRHVLLRMADLVSSIEEHTVAARDVAPRLREHVERIDRFMIEAGGEGGLQAFAAYLEEAVPTLPAVGLANTNATNSSNGGVSALLDPVLSVSFNSISPSFSNIINYDSGLPFPHRHAGIGGVGPIVSNGQGGTTSEHSLGAYRNVPTSNTLTQPPASAISTTGLGLHPLRPWNDQYSPSTRFASSSSFDVPQQFVQPPNSIVSQPPIPTNQYQAPNTNHQNQNQNQNANTQGQVQLPDDIFADWSMFLFGETGLQGDAFDFLSTMNDWQPPAQGQGQGQGQG